MTGVDAAERPSTTIHRPLTDAEREMVDANRGLIRVFAAMVPGVDPNDDDVWQAGALGLIRAVKDYDPSRGREFSTYAYWWITSLIRRHAYDGLIHVPRRLLTRKAVGHKYHPHVAAARRVGPIVSARDEGAVNEPPARPRDAVAADERRAALLEAVARLPVRQRAVIEGRLEGRTLRAIGASLGVSRERVRQHEADAHDGLRRMLAEGDDADA